MNKAYISIINPKLRGRSLKRQSGAMLIIAIFLIVVIGLLGASMLTIQKNAAQHGVHDVYATRAYFAAYSAQQVAMSQLAEQASGKASALICIGKQKKVTIDLFDAAGFANCDAYYTCEREDSPVGQVYHVTGAAICHDREASVYRDVSSKIKYPAIPSK